MPEWTTACPDWEQRIVAGQSLIPCAPLFPAEAEAALDIFRGLKIVDAPSSPTMAEACRQWVFDLVATIFGAYDAELGRRLIRYFMLLVAKKNSKSTIAAGIMVTALMRNWRESGEFYILAPTKEIADNSFLPARDMVLADDELRKLLHVQPNVRMITHRNTGAFLKVVAADDETVSGKKTIGLLVDELWLFGKRANAESMLLEAAGGLASRPEGFVIFLTTQSDGQPAGVFKQKLDEFRAIRDGRIVDPRSLGVLYEYPQAMIDREDYLKPEFFGIPNPNLGASVDAEFLSDGLLKAQRAGKQSVTTFLAKHLNIEIGLKLAGDRWRGADYWEEKAEPSLTLEAVLDRSEVVTIGIDGGGLDDLLGLCVLGRDKETRQWLAWTHTWAFSGVLKIRQDIATAVQDFAAAGELTIIEDLGQDVAEVVDIVMQVSASGLLPEKAGIGVDQIGIGQIIDELAAKQITEPLIAGIPQGWKLSGAIKTCERKLADGTLIHASQAIMNWAVGNAKAEPHGNAISITKQRAGSAKIDPLVALFNAAVLMSMNPIASGKSVYEERGMLIV